jgi:hypothetical protein
MEEDKNEKRFVIKDRRLFDESGSVRNEEKSAPEDKPLPTEQESAPATEESPLPEINFASFIFSLSTSAMYHFGDFPDPASGESRRNLPAAKQTIDILTILKTKTEGNLDENEKQLLDGMLYELRMRFIKEMTSK